tara:strand:+ start:2063 stop:3505 length:1443 start_codon:yes stop_codon:yes gene_type:complete
VTPFSAGFAPDLDPTTEGVITDCTNIVPTLRGFEGAAQGVDVGMDLLPYAALHAGLVVKLDASSRLIAGTATKLYEKSGTSWADVSRTAAYNASTTYPWRFAQFGDTTLAVNKGDVIQASTTSGAFADLTAPKASVITVASGFVILGNTLDATYGDSFDRWWCSAYLDATDWVPAISTQCTTGRLVDSPGPITGMKPFGYDVVAYKDNSMYYGRYSGPPGVWDFSLLPGNVGAVSQEAIADIGTAHVFIGNNDIYLFDGSLPRPIGTPLREWFFSDLDVANKHKITNAHDFVNSLVYFYYPRLSGTGELDGCIVYNYKTNKWGLAHKEIGSVVEYILGGYTWDTLPVTTWDSWPEVEYDSPFWINTTKYIAFIGTDRKVYSMTGSSLTASLTTGDYGVENQYSLLSRITLRYLRAPTTATTTNYYQEVHGNTWTADQTVTESSGRFDLFRSAPWHRAKFDFTGTVEIAAIDADIKPDGAL